MSQTSPIVYEAVRAVGTLKPKFNPGQPKAFADQLDVRGTAFCLKDTKVLVTCAHVVQDLLALPIELGGLLVIGHKGLYQRATISIVDHEHDLALLRVEDLLSNGQNLNQSSVGLSFVESTPNVGDEVEYAGFPLGLQLLDSEQSPTFAAGVIGANKRRLPLRKQIQVTGAVVGGFSGSPIVLKGTDQVIGVVSNSPSKEAGEANIFMATSWEHVRALVELSKS